MSNRRFGRHNLPRVMSIEHAWNWWYVDNFCWIKSSMVNMDSFGNIRWFLKGPNVVQLEWYCRLNLQKNITITITITIIDYHPYHCNLTSPTCSVTQNGGTEAYKAFLGVGFPFISLTYSLCILGTWHVWWWLSKCQFCWETIGTDGQEILNHRLAGEWTNRHRGPPIGGLHFFKTQLTNKV